MSYNTSRSIDNTILTQPEEEEPEKIVQKHGFFDRIIIKENSKWKAAFDIFINLLVAYSCFTTIYFVCFTSYSTIEVDVINIIVEISFFFDIVINFLTEYKDPETYETIRSLSKIAKKYVFRGWFLIDFIAIIPF